MVEGKISKVIGFLNNSLKSNGIDVSKIILFGSQTKGTSHPDSDIDLLIISKDFEGKDIFSRAELTKEAEIQTIKKYVLPLDIITMTPDEYENEKSIVVEYAKDGETIYDEAS